MGNDFLRADGRRYRRGLHVLDDLARRQECCADILRHYSRNRNANPGKYPVMALESDTYQHSNAQYGRIKYPVFKKVGWEDQAVFWKALGGEAPAVEETEQKKPNAEQMDDSI